MTIDHSEIESAGCGTTEIEIWGWVWVARKDSMFLRC